MTLDQIYYFLEIVKAGSMSQAAANMHVSQPNISMTIKSLEKEFDFTLFKRGAKGVELTRQGAEFLHHAESIVSSVNGIEQIAHVASEKTITFSITAQYTSAAIYPVIEMLRLFDKKKKTLTIRQSPFFDVVRDVESGHSNLGLINISADQMGFIQTLLEKKGLEFVPIDQHEMAAALAKEHPLYDKTTLALSDLKKSPLVLVEYANKDYLSVQDMKQLELESFETKIFVQDMLYVLHLLSAIHAVTFVSTSKNHDFRQLTNPYGKHLKIFSLEKPVIIDFGYIKKAATPLSFTEQYYVNALVDFFTA